MTGGVLCTMYTAGWCAENDIFDTKLIQYPFKPKYEANTPMLDSRPRSHFLGPTFQVPEKVIPARVFHFLIRF